MRPEREAAEGVLEFRERLEDVTAAQHEPAADPAQSVIEIGERIAEETPVAERGIVLAPKIRFDHIERHHRAAFRCIAERRVVVQTQIAFEPHHLWRHDSAASSAASSESTCCAVCAADSVTRRRAVPSGTVGGRMAVTR